MKNVRESEKKVGTLTRSPATRWVGVALVFLFFPVASRAADEGKIKSNLAVVDEKLLFCQPDSSLTVLDFPTGKVLVRDPTAECKGEFQGAGQGELLLSSFQQFRVIDLPQTLARGRLTTSSEFGFADPGCRASLLLRDSFICAHLADPVVEMRSLAHGKLLWQYDSRGDVADVAESNGRILLTLGAYFRPKEMVLLGAASGKELLRRPIEQDGNHYLRVKQFSGDRIALEGTSPDCKGVITRDLEVRATRNDATKDACKPGELSGRPPSCPPGSSCTYFTKVSRNSRRALERGDALVTIERVRSGTVIFWINSARVWRAFDRMSDLYAIAEIKGRLLVETVTPNLGILECLSFQYGEPQWMYVYPVGKPNGETPAVWERTRSQRPKGTVLLPPSNDFRPILDDEAALDKLRHAPVIFDPKPNEKPAH